MGIFTFIKVMKELRWLTSLTFILTIYTAGANIDLSSNINDKLTNTSNISDKGSKGEIGCNCGITTRSSRKNYGDNKIIEGNNRIIDGEDAKVNEYPWMVSLVEVYWIFNFHFCGGTLISSRHVLTAAHCVIDFRPQDIGVSLGEHNIKDQEFTIVKVTDILNHPQYNGWKYDISILTLEEKVIFSNTVYPACLPSDPSEQYAGQLGVITGWGRTEFGSPATYLQKLDVSIWPNDQCQQIYGPYYISDPNICITGKSACQGDSGGPLIVQEKGRTVLVGIASWVWGAACLSDSPTVYARITDQLDWIKMYTKGAMDSNCKILS